MRELAHSGENGLQYKNDSNCDLKIYRIYIYIRESVDSLYRDDTGEISRDPRTKRLKLGENHSLGLQNILAIVYRPISTYTCPPQAHTIDNIVPLYYLWFKLLYSEYILERSFNK